MNINEQFVEKLIELTKADTITWHYLDKEETLYKVLGLNPGISLFYTVGFDSDASFYTLVKSNFIVLYKKHSDTMSVIDSLVLKTVPNTFKDIKTIELENKNELIRLLNIVKSKFPNSEDIINDILNL